MKNKVQKIRKAVIPAAAPVLRLPRFREEREYGTRRVISDMEVNL